MGQDKLAQGFRIGSRRQVSAWHRYLKLGTLCVLGVVTIAASASTRKAIALTTVLADWRFDPAQSELEITLKNGITPRYFLLAEPPRIVVDLPNTELESAQLQQTYSGAVRQVRVSQFQEGITRIVLELSPEVVLAPGQVQMQQLESSEAGNRWVVRPLIAQSPATAIPQSPESLPPAIVPIDPGGVVNVPAVNRPEVVVPTTPPATQPSTGMPTNQIPTVTVPSLQTPSPQTPTPDTTSQPIEESLEGGSPAPSSSSIVEFGQPLPTTPANTVPTPQSTLPTPAPSAAGDVPETVAMAVSPGMIPAGTWLSLRYGGEQPLRLKNYQLRQEVLLLEEDLRDRTNQIIVPAGTPIIGQFETNGSTSRFIATAVVLGNSNLSVEAQSELLDDNQWVGESQVLRHSTFGALAGILLGGFSSLSWWGNAAASEAITLPGVALPSTIQPGQVLQVQLQSDWGDGGMGR